MSLLACASTKTGRLGGQFLRYFLVGGLAFAVDFTLLFLLTHFGRLHYLLSASIAFMVGAERRPGTQATPSPAGHG